MRQEPNWKRMETLAKRSQMLTVREWNDAVKVGDVVEYREYPEAEPQTFKTRTPAEMLSGHTAVVWLEGKAGCVSVAACKPVVPK